MWGCTNPYIKHAQELVANSKREVQTNSRQQKSSMNAYDDPMGHIGSFLKSSIGRLFDLLTKPMLLLPYALNQTGSLIFYYLLSQEPVSQANPICNALTFVFTAITGILRS